MEKLAINNGNGLEQMITAQKVLLKHYVVIEGLPQYPIDINSREGQKLLKDFCGRLLEELSEAFYEITTAMEYVSTNDMGGAKKAVENYNEEIADAMHFLLEIIIYSGITDITLDRACEDYLEEANLSNLYIANNPLKMLFSLANFLNTQSEIYIPDQHQFTVFTKAEGINNMLIKGGSKISNEGIVKHSIFLWKITHQLNQCKNLLKNKDWNQQDKKVNEIQFYNRLIETVIMFFQYLDFAGLSELSIFHSYLNKNQINLKRIKEGY